MPYPQDADYVERRIEAIEREVPGRTLGDDEFTNLMVDAPPDEWMGFQDAHALLMVMSVCMATSGEVFSKNSIMRSKSASASSE